MFTKMDTKRPFWYLLLSVVVVFAQDFQ